MMKQDNSTIAWNNLGEEWFEFAQKGIGGQGVGIDRQVVEMKYVLGLDGMSNKAPRRTARAIVINAEGKYAVLYVKKHNLFA